MVRITMNTSHLVGNCHVRAWFWQSCRRVHHRSSRLIQPLKSAQKVKSAEEHCLSHGLLVDYGIIRGVEEGAGLYNYLPLAVRSLDKLTRLIETHLAPLGCQRVLLPSITPGALWKSTGRWKRMGPELLRVKDRHNKDLLFSPTHEEAITSCMANMKPIPAKGLPIRAYQISNKFRDEARPKFGLIRAKEFLMKDLYTFDTDLSGAKSTYAEVTQAYENFFKDLGVPFLRVQGDSGDIGGELSHEYHFPANIGQDKLLICTDCGHGLSSELLEGKKEDERKCAACGSEAVAESKGIEVGHTFLLGQKYSKALDASYTGPQGKPVLLEMGCYGLGLSRIMAAAIEVLSSEEGGLRWPDKIVPFSVAVLAPKDGSKEASAMNDTLSFYEKLNGEVFPNDVLLDDRNSITVGKKLREAKKTGYRFIVLFGKDCVKPEGSTESPRVELHEVGTGEVQKLTLPETVQYLATKKN